MMRAKKLKKYRFDRIVRMVKMGYRTPVIAEECGVSIPTVYRVRSLKNWDRFCEYKKQVSLYSKRLYDTNKLNTRIDNTSRLDNEPTPRVSIWSKIFRWW